MLPRTAPTVIYTLTFDTVRLHLQTWTVGSSKGNGNLDVVKLLIEMGAELNVLHRPIFLPSPSEPFGLHSVQGNGNLEAVKLLISKGADVNAVNQYGFTPLHVAISNKLSGIVRVLLKSGADPLIRTIQGESGIPERTTCRRKTYFLFLGSVDARFVLICPQSNCSGTQAVGKESVCPAA